jgi:hypothetical protein
VDIARATVANFFGQMQLTTPSVTTRASGQTLPDPVVVTAAEIATGGARAEQLGSVVVRVNMARVIDVAPPPGEGDMAPTGEFLIEGGLRVDDFLYAIAPAPVVGEQFDSLTGVLAFRNANSKLEPRDSADVVLGAPVISRISPMTAFIREGARGAMTIPTPIELVMTRTVSTSTFVPITSADAGRLEVVGGGVTIAAGADSATILVNALGRSLASIELTATLDGISASTQVRVLGAADTPSVLDLDPPVTTVPPSGDLTFTVTLDIPAASPSGTLVSLMTRPGIAGAVPTSVLVPADELSAEFRFTAREAEGDEIVTASAGSGSATSTVTVSAVPLGGLVINEVDYDTPGTDSMEFLEIYNATSIPIDLTSVVVIFINGADSDEYRRVPLSGSLAAGAFLLIGNAVVTAPAGTTRIDIPNNGIQNGAPDGIALFDLSSGTLLDALSYEGSLTDATLPGGVMSLVEGTPTSAADSNTGDLSLIRFPDGVDADNAATDWRTTMTPTPGSPNIE